MAQNIVIFNLSIIYLFSQSVLLMYLVAGFLIVSPLYTACSRRECCAFIYYLLFRLYFAFCIKGTITEWASFKLEAEIVTEPNRLCKKGETSMVGHSSFRDLRELTKKNQTSPSASQLLARIGHCNIIHQHVVYDAQQLCVNTSRLWFSIMTSSIDGSAILRDLCTKIV